MNSVAAFNSGIAVGFFGPSISAISNSRTPFFSTSYSPPFNFKQHNGILKNKFTAITRNARNRDPSSQSKSVIKPTIIEEVSAEEDEDDLLAPDEFDDDELFDDRNDFEDEYESEDDEAYVGDGATGGGISLAGTWWDKEALAIAEKVSQSFDGDLSIYAFRTLSNATIQVRIEKSSTKSGSPCMTDIEAFSSAYKDRLDEAELAKSVPENIYLEVSSPGVERVVRIPEDLDRFKDRPMYVKYVSKAADIGSSCENDGIFKLVSFDLETNSCTWCLADVRVNREKAGKGRPMSKKQKEWRLSTPFDCLRLVRLYSEM